MDTVSNALNLLADNGAIIGTETLAGVEIPEYGMATTDLQNISNEYYQTCLIKRV